MEQNQTGRVIFILAVLLAAVLSIVPQPLKLFRHDVPLGEKLNLKPGIDMVGGTSLLYQIKTPEGGFHGNNGQTLAEAVMESLKRRVDPNGVRNLIWRPQGTDRLEIQLPASPNSEEAKKAREAYVAAQQQLSDTNVSSTEVINAVEQLKGDERRDRLNQLAAGSDARAKLFGALASAYDQKQAAHEKRDAELEAQKTEEYDKLKSQVEQSNLAVGQLEAMLDAPADQRTAKLAELKKQYADYPARVSAIDNFVKSYDEYNKLKGSIDDAAQLKRELQGSGVLEFHILANDLPRAEYIAMVDRLKSKGPRVEAGDVVKWFMVDRPQDVQSFGNEVQEWNGKYYALCYITDDKSMVNGPHTNHWTLESAHPSSDGEGGRAVGFTFDAVGGDYFSTFTQNNLKKPLAAILDNKIVSVANINSRIGREGVITRGNGYDDEEFNYLISTLNAGSLPATLADEPISEHTVGPQLGEDNLRRGLMACGFGLIIVAVFLVGYYYLAGVVATFAVFMNVILILGILAAFNATFTLPGIAGIVLTIGAAVDANVLIFERLREEQHHGLSIRMAMRNAYLHARGAIWDSNATTIITSAILIWLGSEEVKGFGLTLLIGLASSLFTSLFVTRTIFNIMIDKFGYQHFGSLPLTFPKWDQFLKPNIDWMKIVPYCLTFSAVFIALGMTAFVMKARAHELADIDFASGTQVQFELKDRTKIEDLRSMFTKADNPALPSPSLVSVNHDDLTYEIVTPNVDAKAVREAVLSVVGTKIKTDLPSKFDHVDESMDQAMGSAIQPIVKTPLVINGFTVPRAENYLGGAAIVLNHLNPPLKVSEIKTRIDQMRVQDESAQSGAEGSRYHDFTVVSPNGPDQPTSTAIVLTGDPNLPYDKDEGKWREELVAPMWKLINQSINRPATLQKVNNFDAAVAGDTQKAAFYSLVLSSLVIMFYIWFRFGNLKYGTATVLAMIHDTFLVVGAIGLSHWMVQYTPGLARILLVEPFRINLTVVAAVLTVMSYSMIDTIVVFDRIRENRGKFGHMSRKIINDSINQTLSRTLLTCGITIMTVASMYFVGGPGVHGFTFVLLVGILVGTYSSIAVAAPILLMGHEAKGDSGGSGGAGWAAAKNPAPTPGKTERAVAVAVNKVKTAG
ncbi:MAG TPA: protein translocase subunit SecD [Tepidisphaeraceae bacterium]|nr:protein translocase subunit SecD [Tepidisphaeraceae bacterium]